MKYIEHRKDKYIIRKRWKGGGFTLSCDDKTSAEDIRDIFVEYGWDVDLSKPKSFLSNGTYYVLYKPEKKVEVLYQSSDKESVDDFLDSYVDTLNISKKGNSYTVQKSIHNKNYNFGFYKSLDEAIEFRDKFRRVDWDYSKFDEIYKDSTLMRNKYINNLPDGRYKIIKVNRYGTNRIYGIFKDKDKAIEYRDWLIAHDWKVPSDRHITKLFGKFWIFKLNRLHGLYTRFYYKYSDNVEDLYELRDEFVVDGFPEDCLFSTTCLHNVSLSGSYYYVEKDDEYFYSSRDLLKTIDVRDVLEEDGWNYIEGFHKVNGREYEFTFNNREEKKVELVEDVDYEEYISSVGDGYVVKCGLFERKYDDYSTSKLIVDYMLRFKWNNRLCEVLEELYVL